MTEKNGNDKKHKCRNSDCKRPIRKSVDGQHYNLCRQCRLDAQMAKEGKPEVDPTISREKRELMKQTSSILLRAGDKYAEVVQVCDRMMSMHGGLEGFCLEWKHQVDTAMSRNPGSRLVLDYFRDLVRLHMKAAEHRPANTDIDAMELEDVSAEVERMASQMGLRLLADENDEDAA